MSKFLDNYGKPRQEYFDSVTSMTDEALYKECEMKIWLSAFAANNRRSDYHWHVDFCYDECKKRGKPEIYQKAFDQASMS
jgi:hypothetical protein